MTSLSEVYEGESGADANLQRLYFGLGLFAAGVVLLVAGMVVATTDLLVGGGTTLADVRKLGGLLGGLGIPAVFLGIFTVMPASRRARAAAIIGASVAVLGVGMFWHAYPCQWSGSNCGAGLADLTLPTVGIYFLGTITTFWTMFVGVANFKTRNDPGGTVTMEVTRKGETRVVEVEPDRSGLGGIGFLGHTPDGDVETQTNPGGRSATVSDGGASTQTVTGFDDDAGVEVTRTERVSAEDRYCGNCAHFEYVRTDSGIQPYCGYHDGLMDDMEACPAWASRRDGQ